ncbi:amino acid adenylation domain-containing protein, partial [Olivibacter sp. CPCC 100613]|uniref:non-ribosomal peptide synthetase n=1 Tax=Olivibacter sp. CPCC 100613 TaxID=3079931 RepID=UPI002FF8A47B
GAWAYLLHRYTGRRDIVYGVTVSGRPEDLSGVEQRIGLYINTIHLFTKLDYSNPIGDWLRFLQAEQANARQYQFSHIHDVQHWTVNKRDLFDSLLVFESYPSNKTSEKVQTKLNLRDGIIEEHTNYPLSIIIEPKEQIVLGFSYNTELIDKFYIDRIIQHFINVLGQIVRGALHLKEINILTPHEIQSFKCHLVHDQQLFSKVTVIDMFRECQRLNSDRIALVFADIKLSYHELDVLSDKLAIHLQALGIGPEIIAGICMERSHWTIVSILAILKTGGAYVPLDPEYPVERLSFIVQDSGCRVIVADNMGKLSISSFYKGILVYTDQSAEWNDGLGEIKLENKPLSDTLAYVLYTSGSTGKPKGVMVEHGNIISLLNAFENIAPGKGNLNGFALCPIVFDVSIWEIFTNLCYGHTLHLLPSEAANDPFYIAKYIVDHQINTAYLPPTLLNEILREFQNNNDTIALTRLLVGVMQIKEIVLQQYQERIPQLRIINGYGPTEATVCATFYEFKQMLSKGNSYVPIGKPLLNSEVFIVDANYTDSQGENIRLQPIGVAGEICITGPHVARGYLNQPDLTVDRFIPSPFVDGKQMYRTGDIGCWLPDGNLEYLGRIDNQVKLRGYRIELGEIETVAIESGLMDQAVVILQKTDDLERLVGYAVLKDELDYDCLLSYLHARLPEYMVPIFWMKLEKIPVTKNGKIDYTSLPKVEPNIHYDRYEPPTNKVEISLIKIWSEILCIQKMGVYDNFFSLGGHSLAAIRIISAIRKELRTEISIKDLFGYPTVKQLSDKISRSTNSWSIKSIEIRVNDGIYPLSYSQERLWFIDRLEGSVHYHVPVVYGIRGGLVDVDLL